MQDKTPLEVSASGPVGGRLENSSARRLIKLAAVGVVLSGSIMVHHSTSATTAPQSNSKNPMPAIEKNIALGLNHFDAHCAGCHGTSGKADTEKGRTVSAADLTSEAVQSKSDAELFRTISNGVPGTAMPAFARTHKAAEIWQTVLFLRKLPTLTPEEKEKLERAVPAGARHRHGAEQEHQHPDAEDSEGKTHHQHPAKEASKPSSTQQSPSTEQQHQHEPPQSQKSQEMARPAHTHETHRSAEQPVPTQPHEEHRHDAHPATGQTSEVKQGVSKTENEHSGHEMPEAHGAHNMDAMLSTITGGPFSSMTAIGSGTSLMPASSPGYMFHWMKGAWMIMAHGDLKAGFNHQGGPRGVNKAESQNWFMLMAERKAGPGQLILRGMFSAEPATAPRRGFPELFQTGETFKGRPIIDAQHPHDLFMELAVAYNIRLSEHVALNFYGGPVAEPALGPVAFMHRVSASENPAAPLGHHWQDSTHISHGVLTAGVTAWRFRVETSLFRGAEPDENRKDIELGKLDSWSGRIWFTPTKEWAVQFSYGHLVHPEAVQPGNLERMTSSISYNRSWADGNWATSLIWGRNHEMHGNSNAYLLESTANFLDKNYLYTRMELVDKAGLLEENIFGRSGVDAFHPIGNGFELGDRFEQPFRVAAFTFGGVRDIVADSKVRMGIGADVTFYQVPEGLKPIYGSSPTSFHLFIRIRPGKM